jgi:hypothetical protein
VAAGVDPEDVASAAAASDAVRVRELGRVEALVVLGARGVGAVAPGGGGDRLPGDGDVAAGDEGVVRSATPAPA